MKERFETFTVLIAKISKNIKKIKNRAMAEYDLKSAHVSCLYHLYVSKRLTATELCEKCEEDKATISRSLDYLEKNGYVTLDDKAPNKYRRHFVLTDKGAVVGRALAVKVSDMLLGLDAELTDEERAEFYRSLSIISNNLECVAKSQ